MKFKNSEVFEKFMEPILEVLKKNSCARKCKTITDLDWIKMGLLRIFSNETSGRGFLEEFSFANSLQIGVGHFFASLNSKRRESFLKELNEKFLLERNFESDPILQCKSLEKFDIYLGDGHCHKTPIHDQRVDGKKYATQHFYGKNLRTGMMIQLALAEYGDTRKKEHDMRMLKRQTIESLRQCAKIGRKVLWIWDRAGVDFIQWLKWKREGIYFLSREKKSNRLQVLAQPFYDESDPINNGVIANESVGTSNGELFRRVTYQCPESGNIYKFLTNLPREIQPGMVAFLYKKRWNIEKTYNTFKHKLFEQRAWGKSESVKNIQANFLCLAHNLSVILNREIEKTTEASGENIHKKHYDRQQKRIDQLVDKNKKSNKSISSLLLKPSSLAEIPKKFYRWLRHYFKSNASWKVAFTALTISYARI